jgi:predicted nucleic acid-binding protein
LTLVLDASVAMAWCLEDETSPYADAVLDRLMASEAVVAPHWGLEVSNALLVAERRGRIGSEDAPALSALLLTLPIAVDPVSRGRALKATHRLARSHGLSSYDAGYLELAVRFGLPIATLDTALARAAEAEGVGHWRAEGPA